MSTQHLRALSCNDGAEARRAVEVILRRCGFSVVAQVASATEAIAAVRVAEPDTVVLDLTLSGDLGLGAVTRIHAAYPDCAVIVVSSFEAIRVAALEAGAYDFVGTADLRALEQSLRRLAGDGRRVRRRSAIAADAQVDTAPTSAPSGATSGSLSTNAPSS